MKFVYAISLLLPVPAAAALISEKGGKRWRAVTCAVSGAELILSLLTAFGEKTALTLFTLAGLDFTLAPDTLGCIFAVLFSALFFAAAVYSAEYLEHDPAAGKFCAAYLLTLGALLGLSMAGELQTYYMFFEFLTFASFPLVLHDRTEKSRAAAVKFLCYSFIGAALALFGLVFSAKLLGTLRFTGGGYGVDGESRSLALAVVFISVMGFGCKAGIMPLHEWLPAAHPQAPAPASAILSGCVTKAGVLGIMRIVFFLFGSAALRGTWVQYALIAAALATVFCGSMLAYKEKVLKKRLAYSTVSQVSYALFGLFLLSEAGFVGAMLQVLFHAVTKVCIFLCAGAVIHGSGRERVYSPNGEFQYCGLGRAMPFTMLAYTLASLSLVGLPPFGGFVSKWYLAEGSFQALGFSGWAGAAVLLGSALLTAGYLLPITAGAFFPAEGQPPAAAKEASWRMTVPVMLLAVLLAVLGVCSFGYADMLLRLAGSLL